MGSNTGWRRERLSFACFSLPLQRKVGAAPHRGNANQPETKSGCHRKGQANAPKACAAKAPSRMPAKRAATHRTPSPKSKKGGGLKKRPAARRAKQKQQKQKPNVNQYSATQPRFR
ncbi:hypothetical protein H3V53_07170 [Paraburkholderia bengalensis]|uniref:Uncharacterized protein n=1 Tax=Paraburkholderia bengalensis TaxID=2747562 RepID=A0ABU8IND6_9BURK